MAITTSFLTGFEHGFIGSAASAGGGLFNGAFGAWSASTSSPRNGNYCAHLIYPGAAAAGSLDQLVSGTNLVMRFAVRVTAFSSSGLCTIGGFFTSSGGGAQGVVQISPTGVLNVLMAGAVTQTGPQIDSTNWHLIELQLNTTAKTLDWKVDGVQQTQAVTASTPTPGTSLLGTTGSTGTYTADFDDWIVGTYTNAATDWYGNGKVLGQLAGVDGTHATITSLSPGDAGTAYSGSPTTVNTMVDDPPGTLGWTATRSTTDNIALRTATLGAYAAIGPAATAQTGQANAVRAIMSYSSSTTLANLAACDVRNSANAITELWGLTGGVGKAYNVTANNFAGAIVTRPAAGWTAAEVNAIRFRFGGCTSADISPVPTVQAMMLEVDWPVGGPPVALLPSQHHRRPQAVHARRGGTPSRAHF